MCEHFLCCFMYIPCSVDITETENERIFQKALVWVAVGVTVDGLAGAESTERVQSVRGSGVAQAHPSPSSAEAPH